ncbi:MAG: hypothetical protein QXO38_05505 [Candidatus Nezhaarchaeales archaeon]
MSAKIPRRLKGLLDRYGVKPSPIIRRGLEEVEEVSRELSGELSHV